MRSTAFSVLLLIVCVLGIGGEAAQAQVLNAPVQQSLRTLIAELQVKIDRQARGDQSALLPQGPIDPALKALGAVKTVTLSAPVAAQGLVNFTARVVHENGVSEWRLGVLPNGQIAAYRFEVIPRTAAAPPPRVTDARHSATRFNAHVAREPRVSTDVMRRPNVNADIVREPHVAARNGNTATMRRLEMDVAPAVREIGPPISNVGPAAPTTTAAPVSETPSPPQFDSRVVEFLLATTRKKVTPPTGDISYSGERAPLSFGAASVRIPDDHKTGRIELPFSWKIFGLSFSFAADEHKHFIIKRVTPLTEAAFGDAVRANGSKTALIFVHGFNTPFEDALYRNAQIVWDLQYKGVSVLFTWASRGSFVDYVYDKDSADLARDPFITLLEKLKRDYGIETVNVLAHSMGNRVVLDALASYAQTSNPVQIARLIMAAPDVDRGIFEQSAPKAKAIVGSMTLYASSADRAMALSRNLAGDSPRAGDVSDAGPIVMPNLETVDVTAAGDEFLGINHDVFAASREVINDISAILNNRPPPRLSQIHAVPDPPALPRYWKFVRPPP